MPQERADSSEYSCTSTPWQEADGPGTRAGATRSVASAVRPSGARAVSRWAPGGRPAQGTGEERVRPSSRVMCRTVPEGRAATGLGRPDGSSPCRTTTVGGSSRRAAASSAAAREARTAAGVPASTSRAASTATTVVSGTGTVTPGDGE